MAVAAWLVAATLGAQTPVLTLDEALRAADDGAYANRIAAGEATERSAGETAALGGMLPTVRFETGYVRTTDPINTFGLTLRQRSITQADFDPTQLNHPDPVGNYMGALVIEQPLVNVDAYVGRAAADRATTAARSAERWTRTTTRLDVIRAYYGAVLAAELVETLEAAAAAAHEHVRQAELLVEQGLATKSDALLASVKAGEVDARLIGARGDRPTALRALATALGEPERSIALPARLPPVAEILVAIDAALAEMPVRPRSDVEAARLGLEAARLDVKRVRSTYLPRLNAFGRFDWNSSSDPFGGKENWTVGLMAQWTPFDGAGRIAEGQAARGREAAARARAEAAAAAARLELESTRNDLATAVARLSIAERAVAQSEEAHRIVARKYDGELATVVELLDAAAVETRTRLELSQALYSTIVAGAERARALGLDPALVVRTAAAADDGGES